jgi:ATP-dependent helicase/nuclease subunit A
MPPFELYTHVLGAGRGRERLLARLGPDAAEPIEAFLGQALAYERGHPASLEGFLHWLELDPRQLKRDPEQARDAVRVMTVHGAKGLEAPIVILADAGPHGDPHAGRLIWHEDELPLWRHSRFRHCAAAIEADRRRQREERQRLLYVALTRARDRLYITGWHNRKPPRDADPCWHAMVAMALAEHETIERFPLTLGRLYEGEALRLQLGAPAAPPQVVTGYTAAELPLPAWVRLPAAEERAARRPLAPSRLAAEEPGPDSPAGTVARDRIRHGLLVHRLLQVLPELPEPARDDAGRRLLERIAPDLPPEARAGLLTETLAVLRLPGLEPLFAPGSRAEQPICGMIGEESFAGQIDRLAVTDDAILIVDYKTTRQPPASMEAAPVAYLRQLAAYSLLLRQIYPGRDIVAALLWTQGPRLDRLPQALLDRHHPDAPATGLPRA